MPRKPARPVTPPRKRRNVRQPDTKPEPAPAPVDDNGIGRVEIRRAAAAGLLTGASPSVVVDNLCSTFGLQERQGWRYVQSVREGWAALEVEERPQQRAHLAQLQHEIVRLAVDKGDLKSANAGVRNLMDIYGVRLTKVELQEGGMDALVAALALTLAQREQREQLMEARTPEAPSDGPVAG